MKQKSALFLALVMLIPVFLTACSGSAAPAPEISLSPTVVPPGLQWPKDRLPLNENGVPMAEVYIVDEETIETLDLETYVQGVLAGEMKNDWPIEALKAQAILARTFVLKFIQEKESRYEGADISTDIEEAQAYDAASINDQIRQAVEETRGMVLAFQDQLPYAWFHAHSGGVTELAREGLGWDQEEPGYTQVVQSNEPDAAANAADAQALKDAQRWSAVFPFEEFETACASIGVDITLSEGSEIAISEHGKSGRTSVITVDGQPIPAAELRIALGSTKMRSTLLTSLLAKNGNVHMAGRGYGHGVGMSQWGAYGMAQNGSSAEEIVKHYFRGIMIEKLW